MGGLSKLGPGLLFAASAVGVSHLVQSTRAGAEFGLTMVVLILAVCLIKYPAFRFGAEYAAAAKESVLEAYARQGRWLLALFLIALAVEGLVVIPAVSLVAAGMTLNLLGITADEVIVTMAIVALGSVALALGRYRLLENVCKVFVVIFAALTIVATLATFAELGGDRALAAPFELTRDNLFFAVAVAGWMPVGMGGAVFLSLWVVAKSEWTGRPIGIDEARRDFNIGYVGTVLLALCFLFMGTVLLFGTDVELAAGSAGFAAGLVNLFAEAVGGWVRPVIGIAAVAVMYSTVLTVVDGFPRVYANVIKRLFDLDMEEQRLYVVCLLVQGAVALVLLLAFLASFGAFIDFATTAGFVAAPAIAYLNHRVIQGLEGEGHPPRWLRLWSAVGVSVLGLVSVSYLVFRFA